MREFNLDLLIGKDVVVNCKTTEEEQEFLKYLKDKGFKWCSESEIFSNNYYNHKEYDKDTCFYLTKIGLLYSSVDFYKSVNFKILSLNDLVIKPKNNFKEFGFEADFEGDICFENINGFLIGYVNKPVGKIIKQWRKNDGNCFCMEGYDDRQYELKPIKKEWYENPDNFPCIVLDRNYNMFLAKGIDIDNFLTQEFNKQIGHVKHFRPATEEEVLVLLVKE